MTKISRDVTFTESEVVQWCDRSDDSNQIHLSEDVARDGPFGERVVPGMMVLDRVSGLLSEYGQKEGVIPIISGIAGARFREPIPFNHEVTLSVEEVDRDSKMVYIDFKATDEDDLFAHGTVSIVES